MGDMTKHTEPAGQLHLFGQLDIFDALALDAEQPTPAQSYLDPEHRINRRLAARHARAAQLEQAAAQGRADVAAGADPFAGIPGAHDAPTAGPDARRPWCLLCGREIVRAGLGWAHRAGGGRASRGPAHTAHPA